MHRAPHLANHSFTGLQHLTALFIGSYSISQFSQSQLHRFIASYSIYYSSLQYKQYNFQHSSSFYKMHQSQQSQVHKFSFNYAWLTAIIGSHLALGLHFFVQLLLFKVFSIYSIHHLTDSSSFVSLAVIIHSFHYSTVTPKIEPFHGFIILQFTAFHELQHHIFGSQHFQNYSTFMQFISKQSPITSHIFCYYSHSFSFASITAFINHQHLFVPDYSAVIIHTVVRQLSSIQEASISRSLVEALQSFLKHISLQKLCSSSVICQQFFGHLLAFLAVLLLICCSIHQKLQLFVFIGSADSIFIKKDRDTNIGSTAVGNILQSN